MSWSRFELRVRLAPLNQFKPSSKYFTDRSKAVLLLWIFYVFVLSCVCYVFVRVCLYVLCGHLLGEGWPLGSRLWCLLWVCHFPIGILGQVWYLIVSIPDLCTFTYFKNQTSFAKQTEFEESANLPSSKFLQHIYLGKWNAAGPQQHTKDKPGMLTYKVGHPCRVRFIWLHE